MHSCDLETINHAQVSEMMGSVRSHSGVDVASSDCNQALFTDSSAASGVGCATEGNAGHSPLTQSNYAVDMK